MLTMESRIHVPGVTGQEVTTYLLECSDVKYQAWWPGVHLQFHPLAAGGVDHVGDVVLMDETIGSRHVRMTGVVVEAEPGKRIVWQLKKGIRLPVRLVLELAEQDGEVTVRHTINAGWNGPGRLLDPLLGLYFSRGFAAAMDQHVRTEFPLLRDRLRTPGPSNSSQASALPRDEASEPEM